MSNKYVPLDRLREFSESISVFFDVITQSFKPMLMAVLTVAGPVLVLGAIGTEYAQGGQSPYDAIFALFGWGSPVHESDQLTSWLATLVNAAGSIMAYVVVVIFVLEYHRLKRVPSTQEVREALRGVWSRAFGAWIVVVLWCFAAALLFVIPGIYFWVALSLTVTALFAEGLSVGDATKRSRMLIRNDWWWVFGYLFIILICSAVIGWVAELPSFAIALFVRYTAETGGEGVTLTLEILASIVRVISHIVTGCISALTAVAPVVIYYREIERTEGSGLLQRVETIGTNEAPHTSTESF